MSLPDSYLHYAKRRHGMDHERYPWSDLFARKPIVWPNGARVALLIVPTLEFHPLNPSGKPFKAPGAMQTPYPDLRHFTTRDYGNRVGIFRILAVLKEFGLTATVAANAEIARRCPGLLEHIAQQGHELVAGGLHMDALHFGGMDSTVERAYIEQTLAELTPIAPISGWLSPARSQSFETLDLLALAGLSYCLDWPNDELPITMTTAHGNLVAMPLSNELSDRQILLEHKHSEASYTQQLIDAFERVDAESLEYGGRVLSLQLSGYASGLPFRIGALRAALAHITSRPGVWSASGSALLQAWRGAQA
jgi:allantoinase